MHPQGHRPLPQVCLDPAADVEVYKERGPIFGKSVGVGVRFGIRVGTHPSRDVELDNSAPEGMHRFVQCRILGEPSHIGCSGIQISGSDGMTHGPTLLCHRLMGLLILNG